MISQAESVISRVKLYWALSGISGVSLWSKTLNALTSTSQIQLPCGNFYVFNLPFLQEPTAKCNYI